MWVYHHQRMSPGRGMSPPQGTDWVAGSSLRFLSHQGTADVGRLSIQGGQLRDSTAHTCGRRESHSQVTHADAVFDLKHPKLPDATPLDFVHSIFRIPRESRRGGRISPSQAVAYSRTKEGISDSGALAQGSHVRLREMCCCQTWGDVCAAGPTTGLWESLI